MNLRSQKEQTQTIADRVKMNPRVVSKEVTEAPKVSEVKKVTLKKQVSEVVTHRYMLRSMRR